MENFWESEGIYRGNDQTSKTNNEVEKSSLGSLEKIQQQVSDLIKGFLNNKRISVDKAIEQLEDIKISRKNNAQATANLYKTMSKTEDERGDKKPKNHFSPLAQSHNLVSTDASLLGPAVKENRLGIPLIKLNMFSVKQKLRELAPRRSDNSKPVVIKTPVIKDSVIKTPVKVKENLFSPSIHTQEKPISSRGKRERDVKLISPSVLKHALTDYYAKPASGGEYNPEKVFQFLVKQGVRWRRGEFKVLVEGKELNSITLIKSAGIKRDNNSDLTKTDARYEFLSKVFERDLEIDAQTFPLTITPEIAVDKIIQTYGNGNADEALKYLAFQGVKWRTHTFHINNKDKKTKAIALAKLFGVHRKDTNYYYKDDARAELLSKIFNKPLSEIQLVNSHKRNK